MNDEVYLGIDLGTTTTLISRATEGNETILTKVLEIPQRDRNQELMPLNYLPSVAYLTPNNEFIVGLEAMIVGPEENPSHFVRAVKRQMGRNLILPYVDKPPYEIAALYIEKALKEGRNRLPIGDLVFTVTVPASFTSNQRSDTLRALKLACENAGVKYPKDDEGQLFISEPVAAVLAFINREFEHPAEIRKLDFSKQNRLVVYDIGGGTLDLTIVFIEPRKKIVQNLTDLIVHVDSIGYYNPFGGEDFDLTLAKHLYQKLINTYPDLIKIELTSDQRLGVRLQLMNSAKNIKEEISHLIIEKEDDIFGEGDEDPSKFYRASIRVTSRNYSLEGDIHISEYKEIIKDLLIGESRKSIITPLADLLQKNHLDIQSLDGILIVGGMGKLPLIKETLRNYWGNDKVWLYPQPDEAVVTGAAIYSYLRRKHPDFSLHEPAADAYYVRLKDRFDLILPSKTLEGEVKSYELHEESDRILLQIFAGEEPEGDNSIESIYHTLIHQGGTSVPLHKVYQKGTPVWVQMRYESDEGKDNTKVPWIYIWIEKQGDKPDFYIRYSDLVKED